MCLFMIYTFNEKMYNMRRNYVEILHWEKQAVIIDTKKRISCKSNYILRD